MNLHEGHPSTSSNRSTRRVAPLVFTSGFCALVYQIVWTRQFRLVFGASTAASAAVVAIFIAGLGAGGYVLGRRVERSARPLSFYAGLEAGIAAFSAITPWLLDAARAVYIASGGTLALGMTGASIVRLLLATLVLAVPTFLMGGTLPAVARAIETRDDPARRGVALLYGVNTFGAVLGCVLANFAFLEIFGARLTLWIACLLNLLVVVAARSTARKLGPIEGAEVAASTATPDQAPLAPAWITLGSAAVVGFAFFLMELVWYRLLGPLLGGTVFTFGLILAVALAGIGIGSALYTLLLADRPARLSGFALTCLLEAACIAVPYALGDRIALWALLLRPLGALAFGGFVFGWTVICGVVVLPAAIVSGLQFPMLIALLGRGREHVGRDVGFTYAANTIGAIAGALAGGFGLLPAIGALACWRWVVLLLCAWGALACVLSVRSEGRPARLREGALLIVAFFAITARGPTQAWRHSPIGAGRISPTTIGSPNAARDFLAGGRRSIMWEAEGMESSVALERSNGLSFVVSGKSDGNARHDAPTQVMSGVLAAALHPHARTALVIGLGTGSTAGWLARLPQMQRVDVAEIEPAMLKVAEYCSAVNENPLANPKVRVHLGDARELLAVSRDKYDVIFSEPSNPYRAGIASLYTREFYAAVAERLAPGGVFVQWMQAYEIDALTIQLIYSTLSSVFPAVESWNGMPRDLLLVATRKPVVHDLAALRERLKEPVYARAMFSAWRSEGVEGLFAHYVAHPAFAHNLVSLSPDVLNTDDLSPVEFGFGRMLGGDPGLAGASLMAVARKHGQHRPALRGGSLDMRRVDFEREAFMLVNGNAPESVVLDPVYRPRFEVLRAWSTGSFDEALAHWRAIDPAARAQPTALERLAWTEILAHAGDPEAPAHLDALETEQATEARALRAIWLLRTGHAAEARAQLESAAERYRTDPWPLPLTMERWLNVLRDVGLQDPPNAFALGLRRPFAAYVNDGVRLRVRLRLALALGPSHPGCVEVLREYEPHPMWTRRILEFRAACYAAHHDPRLAEAERDVAEFLELEPRSFTDLLPDLKAREE